jgi:hypothetical protein
VKPTELIPLIVLFAVLGIVFFIILSPDYPPPDIKE